MNESVGLVAVSQLLVAEVFVDHQTGEQPAAEWAPATHTTAAATPLGWQPATV